MALIIDAPMPPSCRWHNTNGRNTVVEICPYLQSCSAEFNIDAYRPSDCPIIGEIPNEHGRLIVADALLEKLEKIVLPDDLTHTIAHGILEQIIEDAETIVEATK